MKVYVVYSWVRYEGCDPPESAWSTREAAEKRAREVGNGYVEELEVDQVLEEKP